MKKEKPKPNAGVENQLRCAGFYRIAGLDEVGLGALAGPVVAAAVVFDDYEEIPDLNDSKQLSEKKREELFPIIHQKAEAIGVGIVPVSKVNELNVYWAGRLAMKLAINDIIPPPDYLILDGNKLLDVDIPQQAIIKGDLKCMSIAAASIIAKVTRDRMMIKFAKTYPNYDWPSNKGYRSPKHLAALLEYGITPMHRPGFKDVQKAMEMVQ
jgi:ribonuclease HII